MHDALDVVRRRGSSAHAGTARCSPTSPGSARCAGAHNAQNACFAAAVARRARPVARRRSRPGSHASPACRTGWSRSAGAAACCSSTIPRRPTPIRPRRRCCPSGDIHWILGGEAKEGGIEPLRRLFGRVAKAYLIGEAVRDFAATLEGAVPVQALRHARRGGAEGRARTPPPRAPRQVVLLVAGLRLLRPVPEFRERAATASATSCRRSPEPRPAHPHLARGIRPLRDKRPPSHDRSDMGGVAVHSRRLILSEARVTRSVSKDAALGTSYRA